MRWDPSVIIPVRDIWTIGPPVFPTYVVSHVFRHASQGIGFADCGQQQPDSSVHFRDQDEHQGHVNPTNSVSCSRPCTRCHSNTIATRSRSRPPRVVLNAFTRIASRLCCLARQILTREGCDLFQTPERISPLLHSKDRRELCER